MPQSASPASGRPPLWSRKKDLFHIIFLLAGVFFAFAIDFVPYYPVKLPLWATKIHDQYEATYNDPLITRNPPFLRFLVLIEAVYLVPMSIWCVYGLVQGSKAVLVNLLVLLTHIFITTVICLVEVTWAEDWPKEDINNVIPGYLIFTIASGLLWVDTFQRVRAHFMTKEKSN